MKSKAGEIKELWKKFLYVMPAIRADFEAIPRKGTDQDYVDRCVARHKKIVSDNYTVRPFGQIPTKVAFLYYFFFLFLDIYYIPYTRL